MNIPQKLSLFLLRLSMGWMMFYSGITKIVNSDWSSAGYIANAKTFPGFYAIFLQTNVLPAVNFINEWGLTLLGVSLILGVFVRLSSLFGASLMTLYYFPILQFPHPNPHAYIVDEHIIYALVLLFLAALKAGRFWGLEKWCSSLPLCVRFPRLRNWLG